LLFPPSLLSREVRSNEFALSPLPLSLPFLSSSLPSSPLLFPPLPLLFLSSSLFFFPLLFPSFLSSSLPSWSSPVPFLFFFPLLFPSFLSSSHFFFPLLFSFFLSSPLLLVLSCSPGVLPQFLS
jgi:hypothetical protein